MMKRKITLLVPLLAVAIGLMTACASMGSPDGGAYDETPPRIVKSSPENQSINNKHTKVTLTFDEFIKIENASEKVVVSPPQIEMPEIKANGKHITVTLLDTLKSNTTYTIDFSDAIVDNNEGNPMGAYTYSFSTGENIDTMEVSGTLLEAENLEPIKGMMVGLHSNLADRAFTTLPFDRVSRTDGSGRFVIKGIKPGHYRVYGLKDADGNFTFNQKNEKIAFNKDVIVPSSKPDMRADTLWRDSTHYDSIKQVPYTHYLPDNIVLRAFTEVQTTQYLIKTERDVPNRFTFYFSARNDTLPTLKGLNFDEKDALLLENSEKNDTLMYWIRDTLVSNIDTLQMTLSYLETDSTGQLVPRTDTLELASKTTRQRLAKEHQKEVEEWEKQQRKLLKQKDEKDKETPIPPMPATPLEYTTIGTGASDPDKNVLFEFKEPLLKIDSTAIHLKQKADSTEQDVPFLFIPVKNKLRQYMLYAEWNPKTDYVIQLDTMAFQNIYGRVSEPKKLDVKIQAEDQYAILYMTVVLPDTSIIVQLLDGSDKVVDSKRADKSGLASFFFLKPAKYYVRCFVDSNGDGIWTTGDYATNTQPEAVYYYHQPLELKANWEIRQQWNVSDRPVDQQKPKDITKQKPDGEKKIKSRNAEREREKNKR